MCRLANQTKTKKIKGKLIMNKMIIEQFEVMDNQALASVEGGKVSGGEVVAAIGICATASAVIGGLAGATLVTPYCVGTWGLIRSH